MSDEHYVKRLNPLWEELAGLVKRARTRGVRSLGPEEISRLDRLYRISTIHLAQLRGRTQSAGLAAHVNRLVTDAHSVIYTPAKRAPFRAIARFYLTGFACAVVQGGRFHGAALAFLLAGVAGGWFVAWTEPEGAYLLLPRGEVRLPGSSPEQLEIIMRGGRSMEDSGKASFSAFLFSHNTKVGFMACAAGVFAGIVTVFLMLFNGAMLGAFAAIHVDHGVGAEMWAWILPHGITEIGAIVLCGGAGLILGAAVIDPGHRPRKQALAAAGREALLVVAGVVPMFFFAGLVEGFLRQSHLSTSERFVFAAGTAVFWLLYFFRGAWVLRARAGSAP